MKKTAIAVALGSALMSGIAYATPLSTPIADTPDMASNIILAQVPPGATGGPAGSPNQSAQYTHKKHHRKSKTHH